MDFVLVIFPGCALHTDSPTIAGLFLAMATKAISPESWIAGITQVSPALVEAAGRMAEICLGVPS